MKVNAFKFTITQSMVDNPLSLGNDLFKLNHALGRLQQQDVGKRVYEVNGIYQVENNDQFKKRLIRSNKMIVSDGNEFKKVVKGYNFLTPIVSGHWQSGIYQCELSRGRDVEGERLYGVTVVNTNTMQQERDLNQIFSERAQALAYIKVLGE